MNTIIIIAVILNVLTLVTGIFFLCLVVILDRELNALKSQISTLQDYICRGGERGDEKK